MLAEVLEAGVKKTSPLLQAIIAELDETYEDVLQDHEQLLIVFEWIDEATTRALVKMRDEKEALASMKEQKQGSDALAERYGQDDVWRA
jgi:head-tail adaptor